MLPMPVRDPARQVRPMVESGSAVGWPHQWARWVVAVEWREFAEAMAQLARTLLAQESVQGTLDEIAASAVRLVDGCDAAGILAVRKGRAGTLSSRGDGAEASVRLPGGLGGGPCLRLGAPAPR